MSMPRVVITQQAFPETIQLLSPHAEVIVGPPSRDADALMVFMPDSLDAAFLRSCPNLKIVAAALKGYDNFDVEACTRLGIWFTVVPDLLTQPTAELALALMLGLARNMLAGDRLIRKRRIPRLAADSLWNGPRWQHRRSHWIRRRWPRPRTGAPGIFMPRPVSRSFG